MACTIRPLKLLLPLSSLLALLACSPPAAVPSPNRDTEILREVVASYWRFLFGDVVELRRKYGARIEKLPEVTLAKARERSDVARRHLERLDEIRPERLEHEDWVTLEVLRWDLELEAERANHYWTQFNVTPRWARNTYVPQLFEDFEFRRPADLDEYLRLLGHVPRFTEAILAKLRGQVERGILVPKVGIGPLLPVWRRLAASGTESPFHVAADRLADLAAEHPEEVSAFQAEMERILVSEIEPIQKRLVDYLAGEYSRKAPATIGYSQYPGGREHYLFVAKYFTTVELTPLAMHELGLARVAAITAKMDEVRRSVGFQGTRDEFHRFLKTDSRFLARSPEEVEALLYSFVEKIEPRIDEFFSHRPRAPYGVRRLPEVYERGMTFGYYAPPSDAEPMGYYWYNGSKPDERPLYALEALIYHELLPGHHMQVALQYENERLPLYRQNNFYSAHAEGWATYASQLAREMGGYEDPYYYYGRLASDLRLATRLVVDTGVNALGWSRERAADYMRANTLESENQIASEIVRYVADLPGQVLAYQIGADKIWELRRRAEEKLGERFDIRRFHDAILDYGPMPMKVLDAHVDWFIEQEAR